MASKMERELQKLSGFLEGEANFDTDVQLTLLRPGADLRKSARSKVTMAETREPDTSPKDTPARKRKASAGPRRTSKAVASIHQSTVTNTGLALGENDESSTSTLSDPPSDLNLDDDEVSTSPPAKRQKRRLSSVAQPRASRRSLLSKLKFNDTVTRGKFKDLANAHEAHLDDDTIEFGTQAEIDGVDDESDYLPPSLRRSSDPARNKLAKRAVTSRKTQAPRTQLKSTIPLLSPPPLFEDIRQLDINSRQSLGSPPLRQKSVVLQHLIISREQLQVRAGLDPTTSKHYLIKSTSLTLMPKRNPKPQGAPPVWAESRQVLCETLPYYRSHNAAAYAKDGVVYSFMFDSNASDRDYMDSTVVISRAGGGMEKDEESGEMVQVKDTKDTHVVRAFKNGMKFEQPVCLITGIKNPTARFEVPHKYCVLDWFKPTQVWAEKNGDRRVLRYRFEILDSSRAAWWKGEGVAEAVQLGELPPPFSHKCSYCQQDSQQIYLDGWMCINYDCQALWKFVDGAEPDNSTLVYDPRWLKQRVHWSHASPPQATKPDPWILANNSSQRFDHGMVWEATKGIACPSCGRCGARVHWTYWECRNCKTRYDTPRSIVTPDMLHDWLNPVTTGYAHAKDDCHPSIKLSLLFLGNYRVHVYTIPGIDGFVAHMLANKTVNEEKDGPDDMFLALQNTDIGMKRVGMHNFEEDRLTNQFTKNFGMPYKFVASPDASSFDDAPKAIRDARARLNWSARTLLHTQGRSIDKEFNEVLALGYMQGNKINYHDDGESGLGPTIATLSLGSPAMMTLRMKQRHYKGYSGKHFVNSPPLPGCLKYEERLAACNILQTMDKKSPAYKKRLSELPSELGLYDTTRTDPATGKSIRNRSEQDALISLKLCHGGVVIMHGAAIQEYYEHAVVPEGKLRFALTSRYIDVDSLEENMKPTWTVEDEKEPYDGFKLPEPTR